MYEENNMKNLPVCQRSAHCKDANTCMSCVVGGAVLRVRIRMDMRVMECYDTYTPMQNTHKEGSSVLLCDVVVGLVGRKGNKGVFQIEVEFLRTPRLPNLVQTVPTDAASQMGVKLVILEQP
jgi:hypothetical protein